MKCALLALSFAVCSLVVNAADIWRNLDDEHYRSGVKLATSDLKGKVVLVDRWGVRCPPCRRLLPELEKLWQKFKSRKFVLIGSHCHGWGDRSGIANLVEANKLTYSIYEEAGLKDEPMFNAIPFLYVVAPSGKVVYGGHREAEAEKAIVAELEKLEMKQVKSCIEVKK